MFVKTDLNNLQENFFSLIGDQWMLITAGNIESFNTMTASWGGLGVLWNKNVATVYIRPQRYTLEFVNNQDYFTLCFFDEKYKHILNYCGAHSGRDVDKIANTGLEPIETEKGNIIFRQARLVFECRKLYTDQFNENYMLDESLSAKIYPQKDFHHIFIAEITDCLIDQ